MEFKTGSLFNDRFLAALKTLIETHHTLYPHIPPQGVFFESLVARAFRNAGWPAQQVVLSTANTPKHDLLVGSARISLKTETGVGTVRNLVNITKLCTTEAGVWDSAHLIRHTVEHLSRYEHLLMLRAIWQHESSLHYQLIEIPPGILKLVEATAVLPVGKRPGRQSMAANVFDNDERIFRVHYDGADGKCQIHRLSIDRCVMLAEWDQPLSA
jgi:hypothetical protein